MEFNKTNFTLFKKAYKIALKEDKETFIFEGKEFLTNYAKYVIEYLETQLK